MEFDVITMGSATEDVFARTDAETITVRHHKTSETLLAYPLGSKILIEDLHFEIGGGGTNTATTFARQGLKTGFIGRIGKDPAGYAIFKFLKAEGIEFLGSVGGRTGYSIILDSDEDDRSLLTFKGANNDLAEVTVLAELKAGWLYCSSMMEKSYETMKRVMHTLKERGTKIAFNPSCYQAEKGLFALQEVLALVDVLVLNKEEAEILTGKKAEIRELLHILKKAGPQMVLITDGGNGSHLLDGTYMHAKPAPRTVVETTGAGDAFASGFIAGLARDLDRKEALILGMLNAESVIAIHGAKEHILTRDEADKLLAADKRTIET